MPPLLGRSSAECKDLLSGLWVQHQAQRDEDRSEEVEQESLCATDLGRDQSQKNEVGKRCSKEVCKIANRVEGHSEGESMNEAMFDYAAGGLGSVSGLLLALLVMAVVL